jgi:hypothetical protein
VEFGFCKGAISTADYRFGKDDMNILGPVSGGSTDPWYPIVFGSGGLVYIWIRYVVVERSRRPGLFVMGFATFVCLFMLYVGMRIFSQR